MLNTGWEGLNDIGRSLFQYNVDISEALPGVLGIQGERLFIFRDLGRRVIYFQGFGEIWGF